MSRSSKAVDEIIKALLVGPFADTWLSLSPAYRELFRRAWIGLVAEQFDDREADRELQKPPFYPSERNCSPCVVRILHNRGDYVCCAAGLDKPFALPREHCPFGGPVSRLPLPKVE
jgi:hypothetical protein